MRRPRRSERRIRAAAFPRDKSLRAFAFDANPNIDPAIINTLATCEWVNKGEPSCLIGDSGTGKPHLLIALGAEAAMQGYRVRYALATKLVDETVDRLTFNGAIIQTGTESYRLAHTRAQARTRQLTVRRGSSRSRNYRPALANSSSAC